MLVFSPVNSKGAIRILARKLVFISAIQTDLDGAYE